MIPKYVVGIDASTQSIKAIAWDQNGRPVAEGRAKLEVLTPSALKVEQDADSWWDGAQSALKALTRQLDVSLIEGIAISNQRETMVFLDAAGRPLSRATLWMDRRAKDMTAQLSDQFGADMLHAISGKPVDVIACVYRLAWYRQHEPELLDGAAQIADVQSYLVKKLTDQFVTSWTSADPWGIFDIGTKEWSRSLLEPLGIKPDQLPRPMRQGSRMGEISPAASAATGLAVGTPVFAAGGDGHCAALGTGAVMPGTFYLNLGTALVGGLWASRSELSQYWRTLISPCGSGYILETVQKAGTCLVDWILSNFSRDGITSANFAHLNAEIAKIPVGTDGVVMCPYLLGCMDPHWDANARATITGLTLDHGLAHLYRAALEAMTLELTRSTRKMRDMGLPLDRIIAIGGGAGNPVWLQMIADSSEIPVTQCHSNEASSLGAAITAAVGAGWYAGFAEGCAAMVRLGDTLVPDLTNRKSWNELSQKQASIYARNHPDHE